MPKLRESWKENQRVVFIESLQRNLINTHVWRHGSPSSSLPLVSQEPDFGSHSMTTCRLFSPGYLKILGPGRMLNKNFFHGPEALSNPGLVKTIWWCSQWAITIPSEHSPNIIFERNAMSSVFNWYVQIVDQRVYSTYTHYFLSSPWLDRGGDEGGGVGKRPGRRGNQLIVSNP